LVAPPSYLTEPAERHAFGMALATLPPNLVRGSDVNALGRWAVWLNIWVQCKSNLKTKPDQKFDHKRMSDAEQHLIRLENHLGLTPASRNSIVYRLFQMPSAPVVVEAVPEPDDESPLGFLKRAGRQFD
jgi:phage terminase small subunit